MRLPPSFRLAASQRLVHALAAALVALAPLPAVAGAGESCCSSGREGKQNDRTQPVASGHVQIFLSNCTVIDSAFAPVFNSTGDFMGLRGERDLIEAAVGRRQQQAGPGLRLLAVTMEYYDGKISRSLFESFCRRTCSEVKHPNREAVLSRSSPGQVDIVFDRSDVSITDSRSGYGFSDDDLAQNPDDQLNLGAPVLEDNVGGLWLAAALEWDGKTMSDKEFYGLGRMIYSALRPQSCR